MIEFTCHCTNNLTISFALYEGKNLPSSTISILETRSCEFFKWV